MLLLFRSVKPSVMFPSRLAEMFSDSMLALLQFVTVAYGRDGQPSRPVAEGGNDPTTFFGWLKAEKVGSPRTPFG